LGIAKKSIADQSLPNWLSYGRLLLESLYSSLMLGSSNQNKNSSGKS